MATQRKRNSYINIKNPYTKYVISNTLNLQEYYLNYNQEILELFIYSGTCFLLPFFFGHSQLITGILVNALLILSALNLKGCKLLPIIILPSVGALSAGLLFSGFTWYLVYFIPFIWIGNSILVFSFKYFKLNEKLNYFATLFIGGSLKSAFLFSIAYFLVNLKIVPIIFLTVMGTTQLITSLSGGVVAYLVQKFKKNVTF